MNSLNLASVEKTFEEWRSKRHSRSEPIPEDLWSIALGLYPQYKRSKICDVLRLSGTQFKRRLEGIIPFILNYCRKRNNNYNEPII